MQKIMFNDRYGLTAAVLEGRKTQTRRIIKELKGKPPYSFTLSEFGVDDKGKAVISAEFEPNEFVDIYPKYQIDDIVAVAMAYKGFYGDFKEPLRTELVDSAGFFNKMFVKPDLMPHQIRIEKIRYERLQDISDEDCIAEGVFKWGDPFREGRVEDFGFVGATQHYLTPKEAYAALIDKVSGKGTWQSNPWVFVYDFKHIML